MARSGAPSLRTPLTELIDLSGRTAIVTGGAMGIGLGIVGRLHEAGASILIADLDLQAAEAVREALVERRPGSAHAVGADVSDPESVERMVSAALERFDSLDILVNNAGIYPMAPLEKLDLSTFRHVIDVNLTGLYLCTKAAAERMIARGRGGRIINVTSIDALHPSMVGLAPYDASKHGAWGFTKSVALELAPHRIWVNAIAPGGIATPGTGDMGGEALREFEAQIPMGHMGDPDDIGRAALYLASELSSYMTGAQIVVDGGRLLA
ncbi:MAG TPA: SDR family NAD(P)-dependent oxidoreductase [Solirubrobacteraceae bacterium]|nr:SDR family NAD(P)-dependent oxidoreductase [Solirubrobacteraceae bacterium]